jgi:hypothetical protein
MFIEPLSSQRALQRSAMFLAIPSEVEQVSPHRTRKNILKIERSINISLRRDEEALVGPIILSVEIHRARESAFRLA